MTDAEDTNDEITHHILEYLGNAAFPTWSLRIGLVQLACLDDLPNMQVTHLMMVVNGERQENDETLTDVLGKANTLGILEYRRFRSPLLDYVSCRKVMNHLQHLQSLNRSVTKRGNL